MRNRPAFNMSVVPQCVKDAAQTSTFRIQCKDDGPTTELLIMDDIGSDWVGEGSTAQGVQSFLAANRHRPIDMKVNSLGGSFYDGLSMFNSLLDHPKEVTATITGIAFSAATLPVMAADKVIMPEASDFGIHRAWVLTMGNATELEDAVDWLKSVDDHAALLYQSKTGATLEQVNAWMDGKSDGTKFTAKEALAAGFCDEVIPIKEEKPATAHMARAAALIQQKRIAARLGR